jgi:hypothetical protein
MAEWNLQVWATADDDLGAVFASGDTGLDSLLIGRIPGKMPLERAAWDATNPANYFFVNVGTALSTGLDKHALFIGDYKSTDTTYTVDPADSPIKAELTSGSMVVPPPDWMQQASQDLQNKGVERAFPVEPIVNSVNLLVGYTYKKMDDLTPKGVKLVARNNTMVMNDGRTSYTLTPKGKIDAFPHYKPPAPPGPGPPGPSGGGGGGGGGGDNTGLMVALLLGLLAYALMK